MVMCRTEGAGSSSRETGSAVLALLRPSVHGDAGGPFSRTSWRLPAAESRPKARARAGDEEDEDTADYRTPTCVRFQRTASNAGFAAGVRPPLGEVAGVQAVKERFADTFDKRGYPQTRSSQAGGDDDGAEMVMTTVHRRDGRPRDA